MIDANNSSGKRTRLPKAIWLLSWVSFFADISSEMAYPLLPLFLVSVVGTSTTELGVMEGGAVLLVSWMSAWAGIRSDAPGEARRLPWIQWGYALPVLGKALIASATSWTGVVSGRWLDRLGKGMRSAPRDALIADLIPANRRGEAFGLHRAFDTAGALLGVLLSAALLGWLSGTDLTAKPSSLPAVSTPDWVYRSIFALAAGLGLVSLGLTFLLRAPASVVVTPDHRSGWSTPKASRRVSTLAPRHHFRELSIGYWRWLGILCLFALANSSDTFLLLRLHDLGYSPWAVVMAYSLYNLAYAGFSHPMGKASDRRGRWPLIAAGWWSYTAVYAGFAFLAPIQNWCIWPLLILYGLFMALTEGIGKAAIADLIPSTFRGMGLGYFHAATGSVTFLASLLTGILWDWAGPTVALGVDALIAALALLVLYRMRYFLG